MAKPGPKPTSPEVLRARGSWRAQSRETAARLVFPPSGPKSPAPHLSAAMKRWWQTVATEFQLSESDYLLLQTACESFDLAQKARKVLRKEGLTIVDPKQGTKAHPLVAVSRDARAAFQRALKQLGLEG